MASDPQQMAAQALSHRFFVIRFKDAAGGGTAAYVLAERSAVVTTDNNLFPQVEALFKQVIEKEEALEATILSGDLTADGASYVMMGSMFGSMHR